MSYGVSQLGPWDTLCSVKVNDLHTVVKYKSPDTGLELVHAQVEGPTVHAYCVIAHKCEDNCGIPHVLQHMMWHGSRRYPHSGLLQRIASKCFSTCPEISAEKDHSTYSFSTAGVQGFAMFLPVFFDHIFNPLLQEAVFITEVYHIDSNANDGGTCFDEMKYSEHDPDELCNLALLRTCFGVNSSYSTTHKGKSSLFRAECNLEKVRQFHEKFYHASNCSLIVIGDIEREDLFRALAPVLHNSLRCQRVKPIWTKPWSDELIEPPSEASLTQIEFPLSYLDRPALFGQSLVKIAILGPSSTKNLNACLAMRFMLEYLISGPISSILECSTPSVPPLHSSGQPTSVSFTEFELKRSLFIVNFHQVPSDFVRQIPTILRKAMIQVKRSTFRLRKMIKIILAHHQSALWEIENSPAKKVTKAVISDFLYGTSSQDDLQTFDIRLNSVYTFHHFLSQNGDFWKDVLQTFFLDAVWSTVVAVPSQNLFEKMQSEMRERIDWRLGAENVKYMKRWAQRLKTASRMVQKTPPTEYLQKYPLPNPDSLGSISITRQDNPPWASDTCCNLFIDDVNSNYAILTILMDTSELTIEQKKYLVLFAECIVNAPYIDNHEQFHTAKDSEREIQRDVISVETRFGLEWLGSSGDRSKFSSGNFPHLLSLQLKLEIAKIKEGFYWAQILLWNTKWQAEKLREATVKLIKEVDELEQNGMVVARAILTDFYYHMNSTPKCISLVRQKHFLQGVLEEIPKNMRKIGKMFESIRNCVLRPDNVTVHLSTSLPRMEFHLTENPDAKYALSELFRTTFNYSDWNWDYETKKLSNCPNSCWMKSPDYIRKCCSEQVLGIGGISRGNLVQAAPGIGSYTDPDYPGLLGVIQYFLQIPEGPLFKEVVCQGLCEDLDIFPSPLEGLIYFELRGCPDITAAYTKVFDVMSRYLFESKDGGDEGSTGGGAWDFCHLQSAKSEVVYKLSLEENTPMKVGSRSLLAYYKGVPLKFTRNLMEQITKLTLKQAQILAKRYFYPLFLQPTTCAAVVPGDRVYSIKDGLMHACGKKLSLAPPLETSALAEFSQ